jgi:hypothetical protein
MGSPRFMRSTGRDDSNGGANIRAVVPAFEFRHVMAREPARADWRCRAACDRALTTANEP